MIQLKHLSLFVVISIVLAACQKPYNQVNRPLIPSTTDSISIPDSSISIGDTITYEVFTAEPDGWFGIWSDGDGKISGCVLDSISFGGPVCLPSGWRHSFVIPNKTFQPFISVASKVYNKDVTVNIYKNEKLLATKTDFISTRLLLPAEDSLAAGTAEKPVVTYEVTVSDVDTSKAQDDAWTGRWKEPTNLYSDALYPVQMLMAISSGWRYSFEPAQLPFVMSMGASPYTKDGALVTVKFYVNGKLVASNSGRDWNYPPLTYEVK